MPDERPPIEPKPPRWQPSSDPASIHVPGLDTDASYLDQIEQIDQLITIKLQNIDANFAKMQTILANDILPAVKKFSVGTEPAREAAKFWTAFYEKAAEVRIPTFEDYHSINEQEEEEGETTTTQEQHSQEGGEDPSMLQRTDPEQSTTSSESSFMPTQAQYASTPAGSRHFQNMTGNETEDSSWNATIESPLVRLGREVQGLEMEDSSAMPGDSTFRTEIMFQEEPSESYVAQPKGKGKQCAPEEERTKEQPRVFARQKPNSFMDPAKLYSRTPQRTTLVSRPIIPMSRGKKEVQHDSDSDEDELLDGMSPPRFLSPALPRRKIGLMQSPFKQAASRIQSDILDQTRKGSKPSSSSMYRGISKGGTSLATDSSDISSVPSLSRHFPASDSDSMMSDMDGGGSLESMMQRAGMYGHLQPSSSTTSSNMLGEDEGFPPEEDNTIAPLRPSRHASSGHTPSGPGPGPGQPPTAEDMLAMMQQLSSSNPPPLPPPHALPPPRMQSEDSDSDSPDEGYQLNPGAPSGFMLASARRPTTGDDSFDSSNGGDSFDNIPPPGQGGLGMLQFGVRPQFEEDPMSSDDEGFSPPQRGGRLGGGAAAYEEETLFGPLPNTNAARLAAGGGAGAGLGDGEDEETRRLNLHGDELDTVQFEYRVHPRVMDLQESPTNLRNS